MPESFRPEGIRAALFDLDGTLIDSEAAWHATCNEVLKRYGLPTVTLDAFEREWAGIAVRKNIDRVFKGFSEDEKDTIEAEYKRTFVKNLGHVKLKDHAAEVLTLVKSKGLRSGLVTNSPRHIVERIIKDFRLDSFDVTVCEGEAERTKPYPDPVLKACSRIGVDPREAIYVEDSAPGVAAGKSAGCFTVAIGNSESRKRLREAGADEVFEGLDGLCRLIDRI